MIPRCAALLALATIAHAQQRELTFAWTEGTEFAVACEHSRGDRQFTVRSEFTVRAGPVDTTLTIHRRTARITHVNGAPVPDSLRAKLAGLELDFLLVPDLHVRRDGGVHRAEPRDAFLARCRALRDALVEDGAITADVADAALASIAEPAHYELLAVRVQDTWDLWVGRWRDLDFRERSDATFEGEIELATGDVIEGTFQAKHLGPVTDRQDHVSLRTDFEASGPRLDAAALRWRHKLFGGEDEPFEHVSLEVEESCEVELDPATMKPATVATRRTTRVTVSGEAKSYLEGRRWTFEW